MSDEYECYLRWKMSAQQQIDDYREEVRGLKGKNAKLRELLKDTLPFIAEESGYCVTADCFVYPACCDYDGDEECPAVARIHERARELGVEA